MCFYSQPPTCERVREQLYALAARRRCWVELIPIGCSLTGRSISALAFGPIKGATLMVGGVHGAEWITTMLLICFAQNLVDAMACARPLSGIDARRVGRERGLIIIPAINPDGIEIALTGPEAARTYKDEVTAMIERTGTHHSRWQANARGVDLNHNFDAGWQTLRQMEIEAGITGPGPTRYGGSHPHSEPESKAVVDFIRQVRPRSLYAFHAQGEEIYYRYGENTHPAAEVMARLLGELSGYAVLDPTGTASHGGLKDWFIDTYGRPGFTFEVGRGTNPLPITDLPDIYKKLERTLITASLL
jgi:g-D-glutamyl-meso-diaminopimelate peptidase